MKKDGAVLCEPLAFIAASMICILICASFNLCFLFSPALVLPFFSINYACIIKLFNGYITPYSNSIALYYNTEWNCCIVLHLQCSFVVFMMPLAPCGLGNIVE